MSPVDPLVRGAAPTYDRKKKVGIGCVSVINGAACTISQSVNQGASDIPEPKIDAARPENDGVPHLNANDQRRNGFLQYGSKDGGQNINEAFEFEFAQNAHETTTKA